LSLVLAAVDVLAFPTRRSSDLCRDAPRNIRERAATARGCPSNGDSKGARRWPCPLHIFHRDGDRLGRIPDRKGRLLVARLAEVEDRKSTRLNSSQVKNSYAVFC